MAVSPIYLVRLKRMIERLYDPYRLNKSETLNLKAMLNLDETVEAMRLEAIYSNEAAELVADMERLPTMEELVWGDLREPYVEKLNLCLEEAPTVRKQADAFWETVELAKSMNYRDPSILHGAIQTAKKKQSQFDSYVDSVFRAYDALPPFLARYLEHCGERTYENMPRPVEMMENVYLPDRINSFRQSRIDALVAKLKRLGG